MIGGIDGADFDVGSVFGDGHGRDLPKFSPVKDASVFEFQLSVDVNSYPGFGWASVLIAIIMNGDGTTGAVVKEVVHVNVFRAVATTIVDVEAWIIGGVAVGVALVPTSPIGVSTAIIDIRALRVTSAKPVIIGVKECSIGSSVVKVQVAVVGVPD